MSKTSRELQQLVTSILSKSWDELEALELNERLLFSEKLLRRKGDGSWESIPIMLRVPREYEVREARKEAREWAVEEGIDPAVDTDLFDNLDTMCLLSRCIRNSSEPFEPFEPDAKLLDRKYDKVCLERLWVILDGYRQVIDPRPNAVTDEQLWVLIAAVAEARNVLPLLAFGGDSQNTCIVTMAKELLRLRDSKS